MSTRKPNSAIAPPLKWHGGKHYLAKQIIDLMPPRCANGNKPAPKDRGWLHYVEPYAGGLAVLLAHDPTDISEVVNDLNGELTNFWAVLKDEEKFARFQRRVEATPFSENDYIAAEVMGEVPPKDDWLRAWGFFVKCRQSHSGRMKDFAALTRNRTRRRMNEQASAWLNCIEGLPAVHERLKRVVILNHNALEVIRQQDGPRTLFYLDPPYLHETRTTPDVYAHEMAEDEHVRLLTVLGQIEGRFLLSGYPSKLYDDAAKRWKWQRHEFDLPNNSAGGKAKTRETEVVWCNYETTA